MSLNRKDFLKNIVTTTGVIAFLPQRLLYANSDSSIKKLIQKIGNARDEKERAEILADALENGDYSPHEKESLEKLFFISDHWANGFEKYANPGSEGNEGSGYLCGFLYECKIDRYFFPRTGESDPFFPLFAFYRSRMLLAHLIQSGQISMVPENRNMYINESTRLLKIANESFPQNKLIDAYLGDYQPWKERVSPSPSAPDWANSQRMVLEKLRWMIHWWVDNRQISDGQFGGGWGDDVEIWRNWVPVLFAFEDEKAIKSQEKLFEGLYALPRMQKGYTTYLNDVEHTSEEYSDPLTCMLNMQPDNPVWEQRALKVMDYIENTWSGINERGQLQFKSTWFNVEKIDPDPKKACDSPYHTRLVQPLMLIWLRTGNERIGRFMKSWLKTWVDATFTEENGKPDGIIPAAIHWPDGKPTGGKNWWEPENYHTPLYYYPSQQENMYECFLQAYYITKDENYLKPIVYVAEKRMLDLGNEKPEKYTPGSLEWCLSEIKGIIPGILNKYRLLTGDTSFDAIIKKDAKGYDTFLLDQDIESINLSMQDLKKSLSLSQEFFTTEVRWTDRLFAFSGKYFNYILKETIPSFNAGLLFSSLTGSIGDFKILPVFGVKWKTYPTDIAVLTTLNSTDKFEAQLFHFGDKPRKMSGWFYNLKHGTYKISQSGKKTVNAEINEMNKSVGFTLSPQQLSVLKIEKLN